MEDTKATHSGDINTQRPKRRRSSCFTNSLAKLMKTIAHAHRWCQVLLLHHMIDNIFDTSILKHHAVFYSNAEAWLMSDFKMLTSHDSFQTIAHYVLQLLPSLPASCCLQAPYLRGIVIMWSWLTVKCCLPGLQKIQAFACRWYPFRTTRCWSCFTTFQPLWLLQLRPMFEPAELKSSEEITVINLRLQSELRFCMSLDSPAQIFSHMLGRGNLGFFIRSNLMWN